MARQGRRLMLPLLKRPIPLIADEWAKPEMGTGAVKITPAHDPNDYEVGLRHSLPMINILNPDGTLSAEAGPYQGKTIMDARQAVVADLSREGLVVKVEERQIDLAHSDRSKTPIEPMLADQWFLKMDKLAQLAIDAVVQSRVKIIPERYAKGYIDWLSEKRDWPISRQLWWGHRIPIWYCRDANRRELERAFAGREDIAFRYDEQHAQWLICAREGELPENAVPGRELVRDPDVLDTWFSSALWPFSTLGWPEQTPELRYYYPTDVLVTSRDIITLWVARMVLMGLHHVGEIPFHEVFIHPKILDGYGEGMSKSKGNGVDPLDVIEKFGADALRFGLAYLTTETQDIRMPVDFECPHCSRTMEQTRENRILPRIKCRHCGRAFATQWAEKPEDKALPRGVVVSQRFESARNFCNKLWNAARFALLNLQDYRPGCVTDEELTVEDAWLLSRLSTVTKEVSQALDNYRFADAARILYDFAWDEFCSFYVEMAKLRLQDANLRPTAQRVLAYALDVLSRLLHPMIPFLTEEIWQRLGAVAAERGLVELRPAASSIMLAPWPESDPKRENLEIEARFSLFQEVLRAVRDIRARHGVPPKKALTFSVHCAAAVAEGLAPLTPYFPTLANARLSALGPQVKAPESCAHTVLSNMEVFVDLAELIDVEAEIARKKQEAEKLLHSIAAKEKKLSDESFLKRAPAAVVAKERESLEDLKSRYFAAEETLKRLTAIKQK